ncbi:MAG TPA: LTA synthase family protein [Thermomonas sp.]|nr:LTA synthase family protein [Thermomonas sp.]
MTERAAARAPDDAGPGPASRFLAWYPALLLAQLALAGWALVAGLGEDASGASPTAVGAAAIGNELVGLLRATPVLFLVSWPLLRLRGARARLLAAGAAWSLFLLVEIALEQYFRAARTPLGADLFGYSLAEIRTTIAGSGPDGFGLLGWLLPLALLWLGLAWRSRRAAPRRGRAAAVLVLACMATWALPVAAGLRGFPEAARDLATDKLAFFAADALHWLGGSAQGAATAAVAAHGSGSPGADADAAFPFLHAEATPDALGPYFGPTRDGRPPNIVVIVVEGLGRSFSGPGAPLGSFTPFLDALAERGLYFENFLANQGRTFGVLPSLFGSLPVADQGFAALGRRMPPHAGLFNVLQRQGYQAAFYAGFDLGFDNERAFLHLQEVERQVGLANFGPGYRKNPYSEWGYPDRELVSRVIADAGRLQPPFVLAMQTISMHTTYRFPGQEAYLARLEPRLDALGIPPARRGAYRRDAAIYSTVLYTDDQLRRYFEAAEHAPWYPDTIFLVTGDHRLTEIPMDTYIDRYHVPLLVFSPLLRRPARIGAVSSHLDVTPSLLALLSHSYGLRRPARTTWTGPGLDMGTAFASRHAIPLKHTKTSDVDFVAGRWFVHDDEVAELLDGMHTAPVDDAGVRAWALRQRDAYLAENAAFLRRGALSPDGGAPALVAFAASPAAPAPATVAAPLPAGLGLDAVRAQPGGGGVEVVATFANGDAADSRGFVPLAVLSAGDGRELREAYGAAVVLRAGERRQVRLLLEAPALAPGRYYVSVLPSDPDTGKPVGRGRYKLAVDIAGGAPP